MKPALVRRRRAGGDLYAWQGQRPLVVADFVDGAYRSSGGSTTFAGLFTHSRASDATYVDSSGTIQLIGSGNPRIGHHVYEGGAWVNKGLLLETEARTNLFLNSGTLSTQNVTTSATAYTVSFTGTGTITFSGAHTGSLVGTGTGENNRVYGTFTPSAGTVTCTVTGDVTNAQFEAGSVGSSYIPTAGSTATRAAETLTIASANHLNGTMPAAVSLAMNGTMTYADTNNPYGPLQFWHWLNTLNSGTISTYLDTGAANTGSIRFTQKNEVGIQEDLTTSDVYSPGINVQFNIASRHGATFINGAANGTAATEDLTPTSIVDVSSYAFQLGYVFSGTIDTFRLWAEDIGDTGIAGVTA